MNIYRWPYVGRSLLNVALVCLGLAVLLTIIVVEPLLKMRAMSFEEAADFETFEGTLCGHVASAGPDLIYGGTQLYFDNRDTPSFVVSISSREPSLQNAYQDKNVCVAGRFITAGSDGVPRVRLTDRSRIATQVAVK